MSKKNLVIATVASLAGLWIAGASAATAGTSYLGLDLGAGKIRPGAGLQTGASNPNNMLQMNSAINAAGRLFSGYQVNENFAIESGITKFGNATAKGVYNQSKVTVKTYAVDLVGKAILPLDYGFNVYGKAGAAYLNQKANSHSTDTVTGINYSSNQSAGAIYPTFGAGVGYEITNNVSTDLSWNRIQKVGHSNKLGSTDLVGVSFTYSLN